jgi:hypothetical protein
MLLLMRGSRGRLITFFFVNNSINATLNAAPILGFMQYPLLTFAILTLIT